MLVTEIADAAGLWEATPRMMSSIRGRLADVINDVVEGAGGRVLTSMGDADTTWSVFREASSAILAAWSLRPRVAREVQAGASPVGLLMAIDAGEAELRDGRYDGPTVNRVARLKSVARDDATIVSRAAASLAAAHVPPGAKLVTLGKRTVRGLPQPEELFALVDLNWEVGMETDDSAPRGLPVHLTRFVGRQQEIEDLVRLLTENRLCTITGAAAVGKSRLACELVTSGHPDHPDGVWFVDLATVGEAQHLPDSVIAALDLGEGASGTYAAPSQTRYRSGADRAFEHIGQRRALLVLDNCDHVRSACGALVERLLRTCPNIRVVATGREALGVESEVTYHLGPLEVPGPHDNVSDLRRYDSVVLFVDRARLRQPNLALDTDTLESIGAICRRVEGLPLAIELAASMVGALSVDQIKALPEESQSFSEQRSLETIGWSYRLLPPPEQAVLRRLSVFVGPFGLDAATEVCATDDVPAADVPRSLLSLAQKSLLEVESVGATNRYRLLTATRQFARERLVEVGEHGLVQAKYVDHFVAVVQSAATGLRGPDQARWLSSIEAEHQDLRAAFEAAQAAGGGDDLRLAAPLVRFWLVRGWLTEGRAWVDAALANMKEPSPPRAEALNVSATLACYAGDFASAALSAGEALALGHTSNDPVAVAQANEALGLVAMGLRRTGEGEQRHRDAIAAARDAKDPLLAASALTYLGNGLALRGAATEARARYEEALAIRRAHGDLFGQAWTLFRLGMLTAWEGQFEMAVERLNESLSCASALDYNQVRLLALVGLGEVSYLRTEHDAAERWLSDALALARRLGDRASECIALAGLTQAAVTGGDVAGARRWDAEAAGLASLANLTVLAALLHSRGRLAWACGDPEGAGTRHRGALLLRHQLGDLRAIVEELEALAVIAGQLNDSGDAGVLLGVASAARTATGFPVPPVTASAIRSLQKNIDANDERERTPTTLTPDGLSLHTGIQRALRPRRRAAPISPAT
jgi:predicted ATPase